MTSATASVTFTSPSNANNSSLSNQSSSLAVSIAGVTAAIAQVNLAASAAPAPVATAAPMVSAASLHNRANDQKSAPKSVAAASDVKPASGPAETRINPTRELLGRASPSEKAAITKTLVFWAKGLPNSNDDWTLTALKTGFEKVCFFQICSHIAQDPETLRAIIQLKSLEKHFGIFRDDMIKVFKKDFGSQGRFKGYYKDHVDEFTDIINAILNPDSIRQNSLRTSINTQTPNYIFNNFVGCIEAYLSKQPPAAPTKK